MTGQPNGWLTPNGFGIRREEFDALPDSHPGLARVLQFGVAYNAVTLVPHYPCKGKARCLVELGGMVVLKHGLTLKRGGFVESAAQELGGMLEEPRQRARRAGAAASTTRVYTRRIFSID